MNMCVFDTASVQDRSLAPHQILISILPKVHFHEGSQSVLCYLVYKLIRWNDLVWLQREQSLTQTVVQHFVTPPASKGCKVSTCALESACPLLFATRGFRLLSRRCLVIRDSDDVLFCETEGFGGESLVEDYLNPVVKELKVIAILQVDSEFIQLLLR